MTKSVIVNKLSDHGYPTHDRNYRTAHTEADKKEKKRYPKGYERLKHKESSLDKHELMGKNKRSGKVEVESKFKRYRDEIAYHEKEEHENLKRLDKKHKKRS
jgi:hypothetical protein